MPRFHSIDQQLETEFRTEAELMVFASCFSDKLVTRYPDGSVSVDVRPAPAPARGRPKLEVKKTRAEIQRDYRARKGISALSLPADDVLPLIAALQAASACPMLKAEDRLVLSGLLLKLGG